MSNLAFSYSEYYSEIDSIITNLRDHRDDYGEDLHDALHEIIDGHEYVIYTWRAFSVLAHSSNWLALEDDMEAELSEGGLSAMLPIYAYRAMLADVMEHAGWDTLADARGGE